MTRPMHEIESDIRRLRRILATWPPGLQYAAPTAERRQLVLLRREREDAAREASIDRAAALMDADIEAGWYL